MRRADAKAEWMVVMLVLLSAAEKVATRAATMVDSAAAWMAAVLVYEWAAGKVVL